MGWFWLVFFCCSKKPVAIKMFFIRPFSIPISEVAILEAEHQLSDQLAAENVTVEEEIKNLLSQREGLGERGGGGEYM